jgi:hypothetical protein
VAKRATKPSKDKGQVAAFRKAARELGCDENEERFQGAIRIIARKKPKTPQKSLKSSRN